MQLQFEERGYDVQCFILPAYDFGLPEDRVRAYFLGVQKPSRTFVIPDYTALYAKVKVLVDIFKCRGFHISSALLRDDNKFVLKELHRRLNSQSGKKGWDSNTIDIHRATWNKIGRRWQGENHAHPSDQKSPWWGCLCKREQEVIIYNQYKHAANNAEETAQQAANRAGVDVSNSINWSGAVFKLLEDGRLVTPALMPGGTTWMSQLGDRGLHRLMLGYKAMALQGWPVGDARFAELVGGANDRFMHNLAGNAFPSTVVAALLIAFLFAVEVKDEVGGGAFIPRESDAAEASALLKRAKR